MITINSKPLHEIYPLAYQRLLKPIPSSKPAGFDMFNEMTGGFRAHEFSILCGATGVGKTTFCANMSKSLMISKIPHFVASVETGPTDYAARIISAFADEDWNTGDPVDPMKVKKFHDKYEETFTTSGLHISLYEDRFGIETLKNEILYHIEHFGIKLAIIDNLNFFLDVVSAQNQIVEMDRVIHELIIFCKTVPIHIVMIMHPKKTDHGRVESELDIKGSSTAVQEAQNVFLLNRPNLSTLQGNLCSRYGRELKIAKMRRRGKFVGKALILDTENGVCYKEKGII